ncbi:hypothetical protein AHAS_Ahas16G0167500 [Arachis hypogaea]
MRVKTQMGVAWRIAGHIIMGTTTIMMTRRALRPDGIPKRERGVKRMPFMVPARKSPRKTSWVESLLQSRMPMLPTRNLLDSGVLAFGRELSVMLMGY